MRYLELLNEYRTALSLWSEARFIYPSDTGEVIAATRHLDALENELKFCKQPALVA